MNGGYKKTLRLVIPALLIAIVSFGVGAVVMLQYLTRPNEHTWTGNRFRPAGLVETSLKNGFENMIYNRHLWEDVTWLGVPVLKYPSDQHIQRRQRTLVRHDLRSYAIVLGTGHQC